MGTKKTYSLTKRISLVLLWLFGATVLLSFLNLSFFYRSTYQRTVSDYQKAAMDDALAVSGQMQTAQNQMNWIVSEIKNANTALNAGGYDRFLRYEAMTDSIADSLRISGVMDAIVILPRNSDLVIEAHSMDEEQFVQFLDDCTQRKSQQNQPWGFLTDPVTGKQTHLVFQTQVKKLDTVTMSSLPVAAVYATVPLENLISQTSAGNRQILCYERNNILYTAIARGIPGDLPEAFPASVKTDGTVTLQSERYSVIWVEVPGTEFSLLIPVLRTELIGHMHMVFVTAICIVCVLLALTVYGIRAISRWLHAPIHNLIKDTRHVSEGNENFRLRPSPADEITEISASVNQMLDELQQRNDQIRQSSENLKELQLLHTQSQLRALQSQINPHFLYNTLECVRSIAYAYHVEEISDILNSIILIYRYSGSNASEGTVRTEFDCCGHYANVIRYRFGSKYRIRMELAPEVADVPIPRMVLQPLLENAINHGYATVEGGGEVVVSARDLGSRGVEVSIEDFGCGISQEDLAILMKKIYDEAHPGAESNHIGLRNVHQRLRRTYGADFGLRVESREGSFTKVSIHIPKPGREEAR